MKFRSTDPLLTAAKVIVAVLIALCIFAMAMLVIALGAIFTVTRSDLTASLDAAGAPDFAYWVVVVSIAMIAGLIWLAYQFLRDMWAIIASVDKGDPFRPQNAVLLAHMGWTVLGANITALLVTLQAAWLDKFDQASGVHSEIDFNLGAGGLLLMLTLFILARVFRHGAAMRDDLEGTV
jgi:hypothetical protein